MSNQRGEFQEEFEVLRQFSLDLLGSIQFLRWIGVGLLAFFGLNVVSIIIPLRLLDPAWELETMGQILDFMPLALIGMAFVLYGKQYARTKTSMFFVQVLLWLSLLLGILMFLLIPLSIVDSWRIQTETQQQLQQNLTQRLDRIENVKTQVESTISDSQIVTLAEQFKAQYPTLKLDVEQNPAGIKKQLLALAQEARDTGKSQVKAAIQTQKITLLKTAVKLSIGALISAIWLISLWRAGDWTRKLKKRV